MKLCVPDYILSLKPYVAGKPLEELEREFGIKGAVKLASNENPLGPSPMALEAIRRSAENLHRYPNSGSYDLCHHLARQLNIKCENIVLGNGSDDLIAMLARVLLQPGDEAVLPEPSFLFYEIVIQSSGAVPVGIPLKSETTDLDGMLERMGPKTRLVFVNNPHNPTGSLITKQALDAFVEALPANIVLVIDEAYIEFVKDSRCPNSIDYLNSGKTVVGLRTFSKAYGLAGLRIGYGLMPAYFAELLHRVRQPFNVNALAQAAAIAALEDQDFLEKTVRLVNDEMAFMYNALDELDIHYCRSSANFLLIQLNKKADHVFEDLLRQGVIVRSMSSYGYPDCIRVSVGQHHENVRFLAALGKVT
ncbi:Histidinol-phosphate aminotransferase (EC [Olavius sp. associated proteobacterium Delta 1]|nr:Histidinol-phosphate aminotransferase (EC [Olavius sp. associated proteobacterium Delta 1]